MPFPLKIIIPEGYDFMFCPTFPQNKLKEPIIDEDILTYEIPFLFPGQGFFFSLVKKSVNQTNPSIVNVTGSPDLQMAAVPDLAKDQIFSSKHGAKNIMQEGDNQLDVKSGAGGGFSGK